MTSAVGHTYMDEGECWVLKLCLSPQGACCVVREQAGTETDPAVQGTLQQGPAWGRFSGNLG